MRKSEWTQTTWAILAAISAATAVVLFLVSFVPLPTWIENYVQAADILYVGAFVLMLVVPAHAAVLVIEGVARFGNASWGQIVLHLVFTLVEVGIASVYVVTILSSPFG